jgi:hypothetical protein
MKLYKTKIYAIVLFALFAFSFIPIFTASAADSSPIAEEKLQAFLTDVLGIDLVRYSIIQKDSGSEYPSELGGVVLEEGAAVIYNSTENQFYVNIEFRNGYIHSFHLYSVRGSLIYQQPSTSVVAETRNILERYKIYAEKYEIDTVHIISALSLLGKASDAPASETTSNLNGISNFNTIEEISGNMIMTAKEAQIRFGPVFNGKDLRTGGMGIQFYDEKLIFYDDWGLYTVACSSSITEEEAKAIALDEAKNYKITLMRDDGSSFEVVPDWSNPRIEIGLDMIPGQNFNTELNNEINSVNSGSTSRDPLGLYPFWGATVYFTKPINNIDGVQVGIWGDTKEIAYVHTSGHLGSSGTSGDTSDTNQNPEPFNIALVITMAAVATAMVSAVAFVAVKKEINNTSVMGLSENLAG